MENDLMRKARIFAAIIAAVAAIGAVGSMDAEDERMVEQEYCRMVAIWHEEAKRGVPPEDRHGWPEFNPEVRCERDAK